MFCVLPAFNFTFRNLIPFGFKFRPRKAGCLNECPIPSRSPWPRLLFYSLSSSTQTKAIKRYGYDNIIGCLKVEFSFDFVQPACPAWTVSEVKIISNAFSRLHCLVDLCRNIHIYTKSQGTILHIWFPMAVSVILLSFFTLFHTLKNNIPRLQTRSRLKYDVI